MDDLLGLGEETLLLSRVRTTTFQIVSSRWGILRDLRIFRWSPEMVKPQRTSDYDSCGIWPHTRRGFRHLWTPDTSKIHWSGSGGCIWTIVWRPCVQISVPPLELTYPSQRTVILSSVESKVVGCTMEGSWKRQSKWQVQKSPLKMTRQGKLKPPR